MNRIIKFRAWDKKLLIMLPESEMSAKKSHGVYSLLTDFFNNTDYDIMQYTGLNDKNEEEIYEGDIITYRFKTKTSNDQFTSPVFFDEFMWLTNEHSINRINDVEVIGNIYENPELLK